MASSTIPITVVLSMFIIDRKILSGKGRDWNGITGLRFEVNYQRKKGCDTGSIALWHHLLRRNPFIVPLLI